MADATGSQQALPHDAVDITRSNFFQMLPRVQQALRDCTFFSFDCEMTGLGESSRDEYLDEMNDRYLRIAAAAQSYMITQFGLSTFQPAPGGSTPGGWQACTFNFYVFPQPVEGWQRKFTCDASALAFLTGQGFDFNKFIREGVPCMPARVRDRKLQEVNGNGSDSGREVAVSKPEDVAFVKQLVETVTAWLAGSEPELLLPSTNSFLRLVSYQALAKPQFGVAGYPGFYASKVDSGNGQTQIKLVRASQDEVVAMQAAEKAAKLEAINQGTGFTHVLQAIRECGKPAVGHNCMMDVAYTLAACADPQLPPSWHEYKRMVAGWFSGGVYDTKHLARQLPEVFEGSTALGELFRGLCGGQDNPVRERAMAQLSSAGVRPEEWWPAISHAPGFEKYQGLDAGELAHEAGYDAFMTGSVFLRLLALMQAKAPVAMSVNEDAWGEPGLGPADMLAPARPFLGRLNLMRTDMPHAALSEPDPQVDRPHVFFVEGLAPGTRVVEVQRRFMAAELGKPRITWQGPSSCFVEVEPAQGPLVVSRMAGQKEPLQIVTFAEYSAARKATAAAMAEAPRPNKRPRVGVEAGVEVMEAASRFRCAVM